MSCIAQTRAKWRSCPARRGAERLRTGWRLQQQVGEQAGRFRLFQVLPFSIVNHSRHFVSVTPGYSAH